MSEHRHPQGPSGPGGGVCEGVRAPNPRACPQGQGDQRPKGAPKGLRVRRGTGAAEGLPWERDCISKTFPIPCQEPDPHRNSLTRDLSLTRD